MVFANTTIGRVAWAVDYSHQQLSNMVQCLNGTGTALKAVKTSNRCLGSSPSCAATKINMAS